MSDTFFPVCSPRLPKRPARPADLAHHTLLRSDDEAWKPWFDAVGLAFFAVAGSEKALVYGLNPIMAALLGMLTGIGGGMTRDILLAEIPQVLRSDLYAVAALAGASVVVLGDVFDISYGLSALAGALLCFGLRFMAIQYGWHLPTARLSAQRRAEADSSADEGTH